MRTLFVRPFDVDDIEGIDRQSDELFDDRLADEDWISDATQHPAWTISDNDNRFVMAMGVIPLSADVGYGWMVAAKIIRRYPIQAYVYTNECAQEAVKMLGITCIRCVVATKFSVANKFMENLGFEKILEEKVEDRNCNVYSKEY